jgi:hypothetical protein
VIQTIEGITTKEAYHNEQITSYDKNGNIYGLKRYANSLIDDLNYRSDRYKGNQVTRIDDAVAAGTTSFKEITEQDNEYVYDRNGNMIRDLNKGINWDID